MHFKGPKYCLRRAEFGFGSKQMFRSTVKKQFVEVRAKRGPPLFHCSVGYGLSAIQVFWSELVQKFGIFWQKWVCQEILPRRIAPRCFFYGAICWGSLFSDRNVKMGPDRATVHIEGWNLMCWRIFELYYGLCFIVNTLRRQGAEFI